MANEIVETKAIEQVSDSLYKGVSDIIDNARQEVVVYVNKHSDLMFWHIGHYINEDMGYKQYSAYGSKILATLSQRLTARYGKGYTYTAVTRMMKVARFYSEEMFATHVTEIPCVGMKRSQHGNELFPVWEWQQDAQWLQSVTSQKILM